MRNRVELGAGLVQRLAQTGIVIRFCLQTTVDRLQFVLGIMQRFIPKPLIFWPTACVARLSETVTVTFGDPASATLAADASGV